MKFVFIFIFSVYTLFINAQPPGDRAVIENIVASVNGFNAKLPAEQLYLHFDKKYYAVGDTAWFKAYLLERSSHAYSPISGLLYVEVITSDNKVVKRLSFPVSYGVGWGQINLDKEFEQGNYFIRAYTNWMQNFGDDYFFHQSIVVSDAFSTNWLVKENHTIFSATDKDNIDFALEVRSADNQPARQKDVDLKVLNGNKIIYQQDLQTNAGGILKTKFAIPTAIQKDISVVVDDKKDPSKKTIIPLSFNRPQNIDVQFMPESGYLVAGITSKVGFKAIAENGLGIETEGKIVNSENVPVSSFKSFHKGMGVFEITPEKGETYSAIVMLPDGNTKRFSLPDVKSSGIVLRFDNEEDPDSIRLSIFISPDRVDNKEYHLIGLSRGVVCYGANLIFKNTELHGMIAKNIFPSGVAHFTLMNSREQPLNERMLFIDHADNLNIGIQFYKNNFAARDSIPLHITVTDKQGKPVTGSFSLAVTDDAQVKTDSLDSENIVTAILLAEDIKGFIEAPDYYTSNHDIQAQYALDVLLLTQGWVGYDWKEIMNPPAPGYAAEPQFSISGKVTNLLNKPVNKAHVIIMSSGSRQTVRDTTTDEEGEFAFVNFGRFDSPSFYLQARNAKNNNFGVGIRVNEFRPTQIKFQPVWEPAPWYVNSDSIITRYVQNNQAHQRDLHQDSKFKLLEEVKVKAKKAIKGSSNLNGAGGADQVIDEAEIVKEGNKNLLQLLKEKVKGFIEIYLGDRATYKINSSNAIITIDGISLRNFGSSLKETLEYLDAQDVTGIEVMYSLKNTSRYKSTFLSLDEQMNIIKEVAFIEITTRSGNGVFLKKSPGLAICKPVPLIPSREFYNPRYVLKGATGQVTDLRSTIYWQPALITNNNGEVNTSFYAADTPTTYTVIVQGSDISGSVGYEIEKIFIR